MSSYRFAVLGDPISHSRSPEIHTAMLEMAALHGAYERIRADQDVLSTTIAALRSGVFQGLNVTMPLKSVAAESSDRLTPDAERSQSVNTLTLTEGRVWGHSTDSATLRELATVERFPDAAAILLLGAGGSARAALAGIEDDRPLYVSARRLDQARRLTDTYGGEVVSWGAGVAGALVINTTPLGMRGENLPSDVLEVAAGLIDLPYSSEPTPAMQAAARRHLPTVDGNEFLIRQAMASFRIWTGVLIDYQELVGRLDKHLKSH